MRLLEKYFSYRNIFIITFLFAAIALSYNVAHELPAAKNVLEVIASEMERPIGFGVSILAMTVVGLICLQLRLQTRHSWHEKGSDNQLRTSNPAHSDSR